MQVGASALQTESTVQVTIDEPTSVKPAKHEYVLDVPVTPLLSSTLPLKGDFNVLHAFGEQMGASSDQVEDDKHVVLFAPTSE